MSARLGLALSSIMVFMPLSFPVKGEAGGGPRGSVPNDLGRGQLIQQFLAQQARALQRQQALAQQQFATVLLEHGGSARNSC